MTSERCGAAIGEPSVYRSPATGTVLCSGTVTDGTCSHHSSIKGKYLITLIGIVRI